MTVQGASVTTAQLPLPADVSSRKLEKPLSGWGDGEVSSYLLKNFEKFADPKSREYITRHSLLDAAYPRRNSSFTAQDSEFARELLSRHDLMDKLDVDRRGNMDDKIDRTNIKLVIQGVDAPSTGVVENQPSVTQVASGEQKSIQAWSHSDLTRYLLDNFDPLVNASYGKSSTESVFDRVASGASQYDHIAPLLKSVVSEIMNRPKLRGMIFSGLMSNGQRAVTPEHLKTLLTGTLLTGEMGDPERFKGLSDVGMAKYLLDNMANFFGRLSISRAELLDAATMKSPDINDEQAAFARELLNRPALFDRFDGDKYGRRDHIIGNETVRKFIYSNSPTVSVSPTEQGSPSDWNDKTLMKYLLKGFSLFVDAEAKPFVTRASLERIADSPVNGDYSDLDKSFARELLKRKALFNVLDRSDKGEWDGKIGEKTVLDSLTVHVETSNGQRFIYGDGGELLERWILEFGGFDNRWYRD